MELPVAKQGKQDTSIRHLPEGISQTTNLKSSAALEPVGAPAQNGRALSPVQSVPFTRTMPSHGIGEGALKQIVVLSQQLLHDLCQTYI